MRKIFATLFLSIFFCSVFGITKGNSGEKTKAIEIHNIGISGNTSKDLRKRLDKDLLSLQPDLIIIMVGTNDMLNSRKLVSLEDYEENLAYMLKQLKGSGSQVVLMSPPPVDTTYLFTRHERSAFSIAPNSKLDSVRMIMRKLAQQKDVIFFDLNQIFVDKNLPQHNQDLYIRNVMNSGKADGVHPTAKGYQLIGESLFSFLCENQLLKNVKCLACFGDSITYGAGSKGGGTAQGDNYPSFLNQRVNKQ